MLLLFSCSNEVVVNYCDDVPNTNHPEIAYWFITPDICQNEKYLSDLDSIAKNSPFDFVFLTAREGCDFYDDARMAPIFTKLVEKAHQLHLKIGLQLWNFPGKVDEKYCQSVISEAELQLDVNGMATYEAVAKHIRLKNFYKTTDVTPIKSELFRAFAFKKLKDGVYIPNSLKDITPFCKTIPNKTGDKVIVKVQTGKNLAGYTVYLMVRHRYNHPDMFAYASQSFENILRKYAHIPFDGTALDEFGYMRTTPPWEMKDGETFSERFYSDKMGLILEKKGSSTVEMTLFNERYSPLKAPEIQMRAINEYMQVLRSGPLAVEQNFYRLSKELFGKDCFIGIHNTFHNKLDGDEIWMTGANWWTQPRDYGQTDENSALPTQLGIMLSHPQNIIYNQYYHPQIDTICEKAFTDLRYGIRTHYHAFNDKHWGIGLESPEFLKKVSQVETSVRLLNQFNPGQPDVKLLVVFGTEALTNWFPSAMSRNAYYINNKLEIEEKSIALLKAGYMNALVPSDLIENGQLTLNKENKPTLKGNTFDAIVYLYPQYAQPKTLVFLEKYASNGGKLMLEGRADHDFSGRDIRAQFELLQKNATVVGFDITKIPSLAISKNAIEDGCYTDDRAVVLTDYASLIRNKPKHFDAILNGEYYSGSFIGMLAIQSDKGKLTKITSSGLIDLKRNGKQLLKFEKPQTLFFENKNGEKVFTLVDATKTIRPTICKL